MTIFHVGREPSLLERPAYAIETATVISDAVLIHVEYGEPLRPTCLVTLCVQRKREQNM